MILFFLCKEGRVSLGSQAEGTACSAGKAWFQECEEAFAVRQQEGGCRGSTTFLLFIQSEPRAHGMAQPTFKADRPFFIKLRTLGTLETPC